MWRRIALWAALTAALRSDVSVGSEDLDKTSLLTSSTAIKLEVILGRLTIGLRHRGSSRETRSPAESGGTSEVLVINNECDVPVVRYERSNPQRLLRVEISHFDEVVIQSEELADSWRIPFTYRQPKHGPVQLIVGEGTEEREITAASLWHLLLSEGQICGRSLLAAMDELRPNWDLGMRAQRIEAELFRCALSERPFARADVRQLIQDLDSARFQHRQVAEQRLARMGAMVLPHLNAITDEDRTAGRQWSAEQRARVQRIRHSFTAGGEDTLERVAQWLADDEEIWLALVQDSNMERRRVAEIRVSALQSRDRASY